MKGLTLEFACFGAGVRLFRASQSQMTGGVSFDAKGQSLLSKTQSLPPMLMPKRKSPPAVTASGASQPKEDEETASASGRKRRSSLRRT